jgi:hypothetical protein
MSFPRMVRVRQTFPCPRVADIPRAVAGALDRARGTPEGLGDPAPLSFHAMGRLVPLAASA